MNLMSVCSPISYCLQLNCIHVYAHVYENMHSAVAMYVAMLVMYDAYTCRCEHMYACIPVYLYLFCACKH